MKSYVDFLADEISIHIVVRNLHNIEGYTRFCGCGVSVNIEMDDPSMLHQADANIEMNRRFAKHLTEEFIKAQNIFSATAKVKKNRPRYIGS